MPLLDERSPLGADTGSGIGALSDSQFGKRSRAKGVVRSGRAIHRAEAEPDRIRRRSLASFLPPSPAEDRRRVIHLAERSYKAFIFALGGPVRIASEFLQSGTIANDDAAPLGANESVSFQDMK